MKKLYLIIIFIFAFGISINAQKTAQSLDSLKQEAKKFSLKIVQAYFKENCDFIFNAMSDSLLIMDGDGIISKIGKKEKLCKSMKRAIRDKSKKIKDYIDAYNIEILTRATIEKKFNTKLPKYYKTTHSDFFFLGYELKKGSNTSNFIWDDAFIFMVRKKGGIWFLKGLSG